jgi:NADH:ubiquinone oxidoreductase subunit E
VEARLLVCEGGCCTRLGARAAASAARQALAARDLAERVEVVPVRCIGRCVLGP